MSNKNDERISRLPRVINCGIAVYTALSDAMENAGFDVSEYIIAPVVEYEKWRPDEKPVLTGYVRLSDNTRYGVYIK